jgi:cytochrome c556
MKRSGRAVAVALAFGITAGVAAGAVFAQAKPETLVKQRQSVMTLQGKYFGPMAGMAQGKIPYSADVVRRNAAFLDNLSRMPWDTFDPSTKDVKPSGALPAIWEQADKFKEASARLENEAHKLYEVSQSGDEGAVKAQIGAVGKACGACHNDFRQKQ